MTLTRRAVLGTLSAASYQRILGANDRVQVGFIGYGLIGRQHVADFKNQKDVELAAMCEAHQPRLEEGLQEFANPRAKGYRDFRKMYENKDLQAVVVSTPDHWHALMTILACEAGKDVYVEKPLTLFIDEGKWMVKAARRNKRVVQVGTQQRSGLHYQKARQLVREGYLGKVHNVRMSSSRNVTPGFGKFSEGASAPSELDYEMWLGPAPKRPYHPMRSLYHFRWFWDYSGGQMTNLGAHHIDIVQWVMGVKCPLTVSSVGGRYVLEGDGDTPDTQEAIFQYPGFTAVCSLREGAIGQRRAPGLQFLGQKASLTIDRGGFEIAPEMKIDPNNAVPQFKGHSSGGVQRSAVKPEPYTQPVKEKGSSDQQFDLHVRNFLDCIKSRQRPIADVEDGHQITTACHLANISLRLGGRSVRWDAEKEQIVGDAEAAAMMRRPYRKPWDKVIADLKLG